MPELFVPLLFLHVLGTIVALGPAFAFPLIGSMAGREPQYGNFATRVMHLIDDRVVLPVILSTAVTGIGLIWCVDLQWLDPGYRWLQLSIVVYVVALGFSWFVQRPTVLRVIAMTSRPDEPDAGQTASGPGPVAMRAGLATATAQVGRNGFVLTMLSLALVFLMVVKPQLGF
jgi:hypothetical protein